jgi:hypothetical protein
VNANAWQCSAILGQRVQPFTISGMLYKPWLQFPSQRAFSQALRYRLNQEYVSLLGCAIFAFGFRTVIASVITIFGRHDKRLTGVGDDFHWRFDGLFLRLRVG